MRAFRNPCAPEELRIRIHELVGATASPVRDGPHVHEAISRLDTVERARAAPDRTHSVTRAEQGVDLEAKVFPGRAEPLEEPGHPVYAA